MHSPEDASFFPNLAVQKVHLKISPTSRQTGQSNRLEDYYTKDACKFQISKRADKVPASFAIREIFVLILLLKP
jgi:hypothetical protein